MSNTTVKLQINNFTTTQTKVSNYNQITVQVLLQTHRINNEQTLNT